MLVKRFLKLRGRLEEWGVDQRWVGHKLGKSTSYVCQRMVGKKSWTMEEAYKLCDILQIPPENILDYFPRDGVSRTAVMEILDQAQAKKA